MELADLEDLDFATWKSPWADLDDESPDIDPELAKVLTTRRLLETVADYPRRVGSPSRPSTRPATPDWSSAAWPAPGRVRLDRPELPARVMSFSWVALRRIRRLAPDLDLVMLVETSAQWYRSRPFADADWIAGPGIELVRDRPDLVRRMVKAGLRVHCWTVNAPADIDRCIDLGIEALITDTPGEAVAYVRGCRPMSLRSG